LELPKLLRVVAVSPGDVQTERNNLISVIDEVNRILRGYLVPRNVSLQLWSWETDVFPGPHVDGSQGLIDSILPFKDCDILIGIFWKRFGTPYKGVGSNTEHEIQTAYDSWKATGRPHIMLYFNQEPHFPKSTEETVQMGKVLEFKARFADSLHYKEYTGEREFSDRVRQDLTNFLAPANSQDTTDLPSSESGDTVELLANFNVLRSEGITEAVGEMVITVGSATVSAHQHYDLRVYANTSITNRVRDNVSDALLVYEHNSLAVTIPGHLISSNCLAFRDIAAHAPRTVGPTRLRIKDIRVNANALATGSPIVAAVQLFHAGSDRDPIFHKSAVVGLTSLGFASRVWSNNRPERPFRFRQSTGLNIDLLNSAFVGEVEPTCYITFNELHLNSFKTPLQEGREGTAFGTRLKAVFNNIPVNARLFVTTRDVPNLNSSAIKAVSVALETGELEPGGEDASAGATVRAGGVPIQQLTVTNGSASAVWEWVCSDPTSYSLRTVTFGVVLAFERGKPWFATTTVNCSLAPTSTVTTASPGPVPRFADTSTAVAAFTIEP
jgi:hypothetical protein